MSVEGPIPIARSRRQWEATARSRVRKGQPGSRVEAELVREGLPEQTAKEIVDEAVRTVRSRALKLLIGSVSCAALGLFVTITTYAAASSSSYGGTYFIWFGPVIAGGIVAIVALTRLLSVQR